MSENEILKCLIAFVLGFLVSRMVRGNGLSVGGQGWCGTPGCGIPADPPGWQPIPCSKRPAGDPNYPCRPD